VLHHEEKEKWEAWKPGWESTLTQEEQKLLKFTNELRLDEVKRGGANPTVELEEVAFHELLRACTHKIPIGGGDLSQLKS